MKKRRLFVACCLICIGVFSVVADMFPPIHLSMDATMMREMEGLLLPFGVVESKDAVIGRALLFENQAFFTLDHPHLRRFGAGDFTISLWLKPDIRSKEVPIFLKGETVLTGCILNKSEFKKGGFDLTFYEGIPGFVIAHSVESVEEMNEIEKLKNLLGGREVIDRLWDGNWHHYAITRTGSVFRTFLDGGELGEWTGPTELDLSNAAPLQVGMDTSYNRVWYAGLLDEMVLDFRAWSAQEIKVHYHTVKHACNE